MLQFRNGGYTAKEIEVMIDAVGEAVYWLELTKQDEGLAHYDLCRLRKYLELKHVEQVEHEKRVESRYGS